MTVRQPDNARITLLTAVPKIVTQYAPMRAMLALVERAAASDAPAVIVGERGTGKSVIARSMHRWSARAAAPFVDVRCTGVPAREMERELFGANPDGAFGAPELGAGLFGRAEGGTLFLTEIGALDVRAQGVLLRVLERRSTGRRDGLAARAASLRVIASSRDDLGRRVADGSFQAELLARLSTVRIVLPPLRDRVVDVRPLAEHFLRTRDGLRSLQLSDEAVAMLEAYRWPGNIRELRHVVLRAALHASDGIIRAADLALEGPAAMGGTSGSEGLISLQELERRHIHLVLDRVGWHQGRAAGILGISPKTLYRKMRGYGLQRPAPSHRRTEREYTA